MYLRMDAHKYDLLEKLLPLLTAYEEENALTGPISPSGFGHWLVSRSEAQSETAPTLPEPPPYLDGEISQYLSGLYRYARFYAKKALRHTQLESLDEFGYLIALLEGGATAKVVLITKNIQEIPSGTEVIKRLLRKGWIDEQPDPQDRRSVRVSLNEKGKAALMGSFPQIARIARMVAGNLSVRERMDLLRLLRKLNGFHFPIFSQHRNEELDAILEAYNLK
jgi:DNA-binding MarR family transcriptional regulator